MSVPRGAGGWTPTSLHGLTLAAAQDDMIFAADGQGGFMVPECAGTIDGIAAFVRLLGLVARTRLTLGQIDARIPVAHLLRRSIPTPWAAKGGVMRTVVEAAGEQEIDTTEVYGWSSGRATGYWCYPIRRMRSAACRRGDRRRHRQGCSTSGHRWWSRPDARDMARPGQAVIAMCSEILPLGPRPFAP